MYARGVGEGRTAAGGRADRAALWLPERLRAESPDYRVGNLSELRERRDRLFGVWCRDAGDGTRAAAAGADFLVMREALPASTLASVCEAAAMPVFARGIGLVRAWELGVSEPMPGRWTSVLHGCAGSNGRCVPDAAARHFSRRMVRDLGGDSAAVVPRVCAKGGGCTFAARRRSTIDYAATARGRGRCRVCMDCVRRHRASRLREFGLASARCGLA